MRIASVLSLSTVVVHLGSQVLPGQLFGQGSEEPDYQAAVESRIEEGKPNVRGDDPDWFFLVRELRQAALGEFWTKSWEEVAKNKTDPVPSMKEFNDLLAAKGIDLWIVPVPAKVTIYPEKLASGLSPDAATSLSPFLESMKKVGLTVVDLEPHMKKWRNNESGKKIYCSQDAHYSPYACEKIAELMAKDWIAKNGPVEGEKELSLSDESDLSIEGDQVRDSEWKGSVGPEVLKARYVSQEGTAPQPDEKSPILLLGDSHTLVFSEGQQSGMHCEGAGLFDHLSYQMGKPIDRVGVRGGGLVQARKQLFYKAAGTQGYWETKKLVIWVFSTREFTQSSDRMISIPLER